MVNKDDKIQYLVCSAQLIILDNRYYGTKVLIKYANGDCIEYIFWYKKMLW